MPQVTLPYALGGILYGEYRPYYGAGERHPHHGRHDDGRHGERQRDRDDDVGEKVALLVGRVGRVLLLLYELLQGVHRVREGLVALHLDDGHGGVPLAPPG